MFAQIASCAFLSLMSTSSVRRHTVVRVVALLGLLLGALPTGGCSRPASSPVGQPAEADPEPMKRGPAQPENTDPPSARPEDVKVHVVDEAGFAEALQRHRGKVVLVDFWALWCLECLELFPHTVQLHQRFADQGLRVISVSLDDPDEGRPAVIKFLTDRGAGFENLISRYGAGPHSAEVFDIPGGALPHYKLYDRNGKLRRTFTSAGQTIDVDQIDRAVEELLGEK